MDKLPIIAFKKKNLNTVNGLIFNLQKKKKMEREKEYHLPCFWSFKIYKSCCCTFSLQMAVPTLDGAE